MVLKVESNHQHGKALLRKQTETRAVKTRCGWEAVLRPIPSSLYLGSSFQSYSWKVAFKMMWCYIPLIFVSWQCQYQILGFQGKGKMVIASSHLYDLVIVIDSSRNTMARLSVPWHVHRSSPHNPRLPFFVIPSPAWYRWLLWASCKSESLMVEVLYPVAPESCVVVNVALDKWGR